jgi:lactoylglutathione lyase
VNERQYVELHPGLAAGQDRLVHFALETNDVDAMRHYLRERHAAIRDGIAKNAAGERMLRLQDPEGFGVAFVQRAKGALSPAADAVSRRMLHTGVVVSDLDAASRFYGELLGLKEIWRGARVGAPELSWTNMQVPDGQEYVEFMLYATPPAPDARGTQHHICLEVPDIERAKAWLQARPAATSYTRPLQINVGTNKKRQLNLYDPDGTRVELMEPVTVDGLPSPWSTAPPPRARP